MSLKNKFFISIILCVAIFLNFACFAGAISEKNVAVDAFYTNEQKLICISHRGNTAEYPENSLEGVKSALNMGADFVSVSIDKTSDGVFYLCENESLGNICNAPYDTLSQLSSDQAEKYNLYDIFGNLTDYKLTSLEKLLKETNAFEGIILDVNPDDKDAVYKTLLSSDALDRVIIRVKENPSKLISWSESKDENVSVIAIYKGNIIFNTISAINNITEAEMPAVQYESKNYFNVAYGEFFTNRYLVSDNAVAIASTYSPDLCGQRSDSSDGWNELVKKDYRAIETNNVEAFINYRNECEKLEKAIASLLESCSEIDRSKYSQVTLENLDETVSECTALINDFIFSLDEAQYLYSELLMSLKDLKISAGEVDTRGALNVTVGKLIATLIVGAALLCGQIYVYKMRKKEKERKA